MRLSFTKNILCNKLIELLNTYTHTHTKGKLLSYPIPSDQLGVAGCTRGIPPLPDKDSGLEGSVAALGPK